MTYTLPAGNRASEIAESLSRWYERNARELPWRGSKDPYAVWVSEIMAQQTRIAVTLPYYERFMERFPTVRALAAADPGDVLKAWEGLGYYSRARHLHRAAQEIVDRHGEELPADPEALRTLPGIGEYTAGAISSIAFDRPTPAIDGNVLRVFSRIEANGADVALASTKRSLFAYLRRVIPTGPGEAGLFTQATMELGALVCLPARPLCDRCPVRSLCKAFSLGSPSDFPVRAPKKPRRAERKTVLVVIDETGSVWMRQRTERLLHGLWEFYLLDGAWKERSVREHLLAHGFSCEAVEALGAVRHVFTHVIWEMTGFLCVVRAVGEAQTPEGYLRLSADEAERMPMPSAFALYRRRVSPAVGS